MSLSPDSSWSKLVARDRVLIGAHRGGRFLGPENTLAAAEAGFRAKADFWELDVNLSRDGRAVVIHDETLDRTTNAEEVFPGRAPWSVRDFTRAELSRLDCGSWFLAEDPYGTVKDGRLDPDQAAEYAGTGLPSLVQALEWTAARAWPVNVEIKDQADPGRGRELVAEVLAVIRTTSTAGLALISSFNHDYLTQVRRTDREIPLGVLTSQPVQDPVELVRGLDAQAYHPRQATLTPDQARQLTRAGIPILFWTVNTPAEIRAALKLGPTGLITDEPGQARAVVEPGHG